MLYSHTYGVFILIAQNLTMFIQIKKYRKIIFTWLMSQLLIAIAYLPYLLPLLLGGGGGVIGAIDSNIGGLPTPTIIDPLRSIYQFVFSQRRDRSWDDIFINNVFGLIWLLAISWVHFLRQGKIKPLTFVKNSFIDLREEPDLLNKSLLLGCWFLCPILIPFIASYVVSPMYDTHYTISAAPALYLIIAYGLYSLRKIVPVIASIGALIILIGPGLGYYYETNTKEEWQHAATYVNENSKPGDMIVFAPNMGTGKGYQEIVFDYYYKGSLSGCGIHPNPPSPELITKELLRCIPNHDRFWVIVYEYYKDEHYLSYFRDPNTPAGHLINEQKYYGMTIFLFENR